jgi:predicted kinase
MFKGLPGSGKTTLAKEMVHHSRMSSDYALDWIGRVNKDEIRESLGKEWSREVEREVLEIRDQKISSYLSRGQSVISDDTNLAPKHEASLRGLARKFKADFEIYDLTKVVPIEVCIKRDSLREGKAKVGEKVIKDMATQFLGYKEPLDIVPVEHDPTLPWAIICDLDGTLALHEGLRGPYEHEKAADDRLNLPVRDVLWAMKGFSECQIIYLSGREDKYMGQTLAFLRKNACPDAPLYMRMAGDKRNDTIVKYELFNLFIRGRFNIKFCLDDRDRVVKLWRDMGLPCWQVNYGNF